METIYEPLDWDNIWHSRKIIDLAISFVSIVILFKEAIKHGYIAKFLNSCWDKRWTILCRLL
jgi:hypothetical protein